jgi:hypothetical protein
MKNIYKNARMPIHFIISKFGILKFIFLFLLFFMKKKKKEKIIKEKNLFCRFTQPKAFLFHCRQSIFLYNILWDRVIMWITVFSFFFFFLSKIV